MLYYCWWKTSYTLHEKRGLWFQVCVKCLFLSLVLLNAARRFVQMSMSSVKCPFGILWYTEKKASNYSIYIVSDMMLFYVIGCSVTYRSILENNIGMIPLFMPTMQQNSTPLVAMLLWRVGRFTTWGINHFKNGLSVGQKQGEKQPAPLYMTYNHHHALMLGPQEDLMKLLDNQQVWSSNGAKENGTM